MGEGRTEYLISGNSSLHRLVAASAELAATRKYNEHTKWLHSEWIVDSVTKSQSCDEAKNIAPKSPKNTRIVNDS